MNKTTIMNNVVPVETLRPIQQNVLDILSGILRQSFGPMGSNTTIKHEKALNVYTKDGHTILKNVYFHGIIEQSIKDDIESITRHIVKTVGDGTTSAVMLSSLIFKAINDVTNNTNLPPAEVLKLFNKVVSDITSHIKGYSKPCTSADIYDICMISTNGDEYISNVINSIYDEYGMQVFIDVAAAIDENTTIKAYDGMTINTGFTDPCFVTNNTTNEAVVDNPRIYFFQDPIDTKEMAVIFDAILSKNIVGPYNNYAQTGVMDGFVPTVIVAPKISRDLSSLMNKIVALMNNLDAANKLPLLIITDFHQPEVVGDIAKMTGAPSIHKYIDPELMRSDIESGDCPTPDNVQEFCGYCDQVISRTSKTSFINPAMMKNDDGEYTSTYTNLLNFLEGELSRARESGEDARYVGTLKRRIHSLKSNLVELSIGGITASDRDALRDLVEDAVKNCRSAAANGVGYGANFMGLKSSCDVCVSYVKRDIDDEATNREKEIFNVEQQIASLIYGAYATIVTELYSTAGVDNPAMMVNQSIDMDCPYNIRTGKFDDNVKSSIESDIIVLETVNKIIGLMATCNQFVVPSPMHNVYVD